VKAIVGSNSAPEGSPARVTTNSSPEAFVKYSSSSSGRKEKP